MSSIKPNDLNELKKLGKPSDIIKLIFDTVSILKMAPLVRTDTCDVTLGVGPNKKTFMFLKDSYKIVQGGLLSDTRSLLTPTLMQSLAITLTLSLSKLHHLLTHHFIIHSTFIIKLTLYLNSYPLVIRRQVLANDHAVFTSGKRLH